MNTSLNGRIDDLNANLTARIDETNRRIEDVNASLNGRIDGLERRMDVLERRIENLERSVAALREQLARELGHITGSLQALHERVDLVMRHRHNESTGEVILTPEQVAAD